MPVQPKEVTGMDFGDITRGGHGLKDRKTMSVHNHCELCNSLETELETARKALAVLRYDYAVMSATVERLQPCPVCAHQLDDHINGGCQIQTCNLGTACFRLA
jgi:hypothetical protein